MIAITSDLMIRHDRPTAFLTMTYARAVVEGGGIPVILPPMERAMDGVMDGVMDELIDRFDGFLLSGGDDPRTEGFGVATHHEAVPVLEARQSFETRLIASLSEHPETPVLGICLGMQMLALCRGGALNQHLPETHKAHATHWGHTHRFDSIVGGVLPHGQVYSKHRQAVSDPGTMRVVGRSPDGLIEAIDDPNRAFTVGVQWHPERTDDPELGQGVINLLIEAAKRRFGR